MKDQVYAVNLRPGNFVSPSADLRQQYTHGTRMPLTMNSRKLGPTNLDVRKYEPAFLFVSYTAKWSKLSSLL